MPVQAHDHNLVISTGTKCRSRRWLTVALQNMSTFYRRTFILITKSLQNLRESTPNTTPPAPPSTFQMQKQVVEAIKKACTENKLEKVFYFSFCLNAHISLCRQTPESPVCHHMVKRGICSYNSLHDNVLPGYRGVREKGIRYALPSIHMVQSRESRRNTDQTVCPLLHDMANVQPK